MKILEAKKTKRGYYFKILVNNEAPKGEEPIIEEFRWGFAKKREKSGKLILDANGDFIPQNFPETMFPEIKRQLSAKYNSLDIETDLPEKGQIL